MEFEIRLYNDSGNLCLAGVCSFKFLQGLLTEHDMGYLKWDESTSSFVESEGTDSTTE